MNDVGGRINIHFLFSFFFARNKNRRQTWLSSLLNIIVIVIFENWHIFLFIIKDCFNMLLIFLSLFLLLNNRQVKYRFVFFLLLFIYLHILKSLVKCSRKSFFHLFQNESELISSVTASLVHRWWSSAYNSTCLRW